MHSYTPTQLNLDSSLDDCRKELTDVESDSSELDESEIMLSLVRKNISSVQIVFFREFYEADNPLRHTDRHGQDLLMLYLLHASTLDKTTIMKFIDSHEFRYN